MNVDHLIGDVSPVAFSVAGLLLIHVHPILSDVALTTSIMYSAIKIYMDFLSPIYKKYNEKRKNVPRGTDGDAR